MYPHQNNLRERRGGQPPMAPHLMGMPQQGPGVIMSMPNQPVPIMQNHHFSNQNSYSSQGQTNVSSYMTQQQGPPQQSNYNQGNYNNPQVVLNKHTVNRNKYYRKEYNIKDSMNFNNTCPKKYNNFPNNNYNSGSNFGNYCPSNYNGHYQPHQPQEVTHEKAANNGDITTGCIRKEVEEKENFSKAPENQQECAGQNQNTLAPCKEKTPMCLINELARFNKIPLQYRLTNEQGPAHQKSFTVTLTLGVDDKKEEYTAEGTSIKKAQHSVAAEALSKTSFPHPTPKTTKNHHSGKLYITPTVELNALAMKRGEPAVYKVISGPQTQTALPAHSTYSYRRHYGRGRPAAKPHYHPGATFTVSLKVGAWEFTGEGPSPQSARHDAASKALIELKKLPDPGDDCATDMMQGNTASNSTQENESPVKSPVSLVHEIALKRNMNVLFEVVSENGPAHMKTFVTKCMVGEFSALGEGHGKKESKKRAAKNMLIELKKLPPLSPSRTVRNPRMPHLRRKSLHMKKKPRNIIKVNQEVKKDSDLDGENPVSRLMQIQQLRKEKEPVYTLVEERGGMTRRREFVMEVSAGNYIALGNGPNKKLAKKAAAQNLLVKMGFTKADGNPAKSALKPQEGSQDLNKDRKVTFMDSNKATDSAGGSMGRQLKPGIYVMSNDQHSPPHSTSSTSLQRTAIIARELLQTGKSPTAEALFPKAAALQAAGRLYRPKDQLLFLAEMFNFKVQFSDFPKGNHSEFLTLVTLSTDPYHVCNGSGPTIDESQDQASLKALRAIAEMGLDSTTPQKPKDVKKNVRGMVPLRQ